ncbi:3'-5' exonuclease [Pseudomonas schmalbachii]|uniref:3'-5' exonuclease n=1 Tax=Pseudomonas schmalbachii TaxID=2816993 RepID=A0ABS3TKI0_9PSED|nr:3'-5' exonuclease [Pseudomonas schmalbachii]MBO3274160.1 3'-5' exonuclease [Pseudomonas schmalbachii]
MTAIVFDTETTGIGPHDEIIEAGWIILPDDPMELNSEEPAVYRHHRELFRPSVPIALGAMATHHIVPEDLEFCRPSSEFSLPPDITYLVGHHVDFDWRMAGQPNVRRICTLALSRTLFPQLDSHTQSAMLYHLFSGNRRYIRTRLKSAHAALDDAENCLLLLTRLLEVLGTSLGVHPTTWDELWQISEQARVPSVMPYGVHRGTSIADLPDDYVSELTQQSDLDPYLLQALRARRPHALAE